MSTSLTKIDQVYSNVLYVHIQILRHGFAILCFIFQAILTAKKGKENQSLKEDILNKTYLRKSLRIEIPITLDREDWTKWEDIPANMVAQALWISLRYSTMPWPPKKKKKQTEKLCTHTWHFQSPIMLYKNDRCCKTKRRDTFTETFGCFKNTEERTLNIDVHEIKILTKPDMQWSSSKVQVLILDDPS